MFSGKKIPRLMLSLLAAGALALLVPLTALAAEVQTGDSITIGPDQVVSDDLYAFGNNVVIQGTVHGDVLAAGSSVSITGHVTGSVMAAGSTVAVSGPVDGSVRLAGNQLTLAAPVGGDALMAGTSLAVNGPGRVGRDALLAGATMSVAAPVERNVKAAGSTLTVASAVGGGIDANVTDLVLANGAVVTGPITYISSHDATVAPTASVGGAVLRTPPVATANPWEVGGVDALALVRGFIGMAVLGLLLVLAFPRATATAAATIQHRWGASLGLGFAVLVGAPVVALFVFALGLFVGGWWIALMLMALYAMLVLVGYIAFAEWLGLTALRVTAPGAHPAWALLVGLLMLGVLSVIPLLGGLVVLAALLFGVGALTLAAWQAYRPTPRVVAVPTATQPSAPLQAAA